MADKTETGPGKAKTGARRKPKPVTLDLKATELAGGAGSDGAGSGGSGGKGGDTAAAGAASAQDEKPGAAPEQPGGTDSEKPPFADSPRNDTASKKPAGKPGARRAALGAVALGGVAGGLIALALLTGFIWTGIAGSGNKSQYGELAGRIAQLETSLGALRQQGQALQEASGADAIAALEARLERLESAVRSLPAGMDGAVLSGLAGRLEALEQRAAAPSQGPGPGDIAALGARLDGVEAGLRDMAARRSEQSAAPDSGSSAVPPDQDDSGSNQTKTMNQTDSGTSERDAGGKPVPAFAHPALALSVAALERAVAGGRPFMRELDAVARLAGPGAEIAALKAHAAGGVVRRSALAASFDGMAASAVAASASAGADGVLDRLASKARSIVRIRPTGAVAGDSTGAIIARAEVRLADGDLAGALAEMEALDGPAMAAAAHWLGQARALADAETQLGALEARVLAQATGRDASGSSNGATGKEGSQ